MSVLRLHSLIEFMPSLLRPGQRCLIKTRTWLQWATSAQTVRLPGWHLETLECKGGPAEVLWQRALGFSRRKCWRIQGATLAESSALSLVLKQGAPQRAFPWRCFGLDLKCLTGCVKRGHQPMALLEARATFKRRVLFGRELGPWLLL